VKLTSEPGAFPDSESESGMNEIEQAARERLDVIVVLLVMQSALGWLSVLATFLFAAAAGALPFFGGAILVGLVGPVLTLALALGLTRLKRWARNGVLAYEALVLLGAAARLLISRGFALQLAPLATGVLLPAVIAGALLSGRMRRAFAKSTAGRPLATIGPETASFKRAA
jgi:hypothetical protein